jgi:ribosomal protein L37AE/L43A
MQILEKRSERLSGDAMQSNSKRDRLVPYDNRSALHNGTSHTLEPVMNAVTKVWSCPTCNNDFSGYYEAQRHIMLASRCTGYKITCRYCGNCINGSTYSKNRHLKSRKCRNMRMRAGAESWNDDEAFL